MSSKRKRQRPGQGAVKGMGAAGAAYDRYDRAAAISRFIILIAVSLLLIVGPFYRGLYFEQELLAAHLISFTLFALWWAVKLLQKRSRFHAGPLDICILALGLFYFASLWWAIHPREAAGEFLKVINYLVIYLLAFDLCRHLKLEKMLPVLEGECGQGRDLPASLWVLLTVLLFSGVALALGGLAAVGGAGIRGAFVWGRLFSPLQYANAAAIYFLAALFLALGLAAACKNRYYRIFLLAAAMILAVSIILTYSRSVWLLIPPLALLFALSAGRGNILRLLLDLAVIFSAAVPAAFAAAHFFQVGAPIVAWAAIAGSIVCGLLMTALVELYISRVSPAGKAIIAGALFFIPALAALLWLQGQLRGPLHLVQAGGEPMEEQYMEQVVSGIDSGAAYRLSLEVKAEGPPGPGSNEEPVAWRIAVLAAVADRITNEYLTNTILEQGGGGSGEWQCREFTFRTPGEVRKLTIRLAGGDPGSAVTFRHVLLQGAGLEKPLRFAAHRILPAELYERVTLFRVNLDEEPRIAHYRDAWEIIGDNPIKGYGGGAWDCLYPAYMTKSYWTTEPHNHYLKVWIEAGLFAFLAFAAIFVTSTILFFQFIRQELLPAGRRIAGAAVYFAVVSLLLHAAVDFSLSLGAVSFFLFTLLGVWRSLAARDDPVKQNSTGGKRFSRWPVAAGLALSLLLLGCTISLWRGSRLSGAAVLAYNRGSLLLAEDLLYRSIKWDPLQALPCSLLADIYRERAEASPERDRAVSLMMKARDLARSAWEKEPCNTTYNRKYGLILLNTGDLEGGLQRLERNIELNPFHPDHYEQLAAALLAVAEYHLGAGEAGRAGLYLKKISGLETSMEQYHESTAALNFYLGKTFFLMQEWERAMPYFRRVEEENPYYSEARKYMDLIGAAEPQG